MTVTAGTAAPETGAAADPARNGQPAPETGTPSPSSDAPVNAASAAASGDSPAPSSNDGQPEPTATVDAELQAALDKAKADADRWKEQARKNEARAKANADAAKELEAVRLANMSEQERLVEETKLATRTEVLREFGMKLVDAEFRAAAAGQLPSEQLEVLLGHLDLSKFLDDDGSVKTEDVATLIKSLVPPTPATPKVDESPATPPGLQPLTPVDTGQGAGRSTPPALNSDEITNALARAVGAPRR